MNQQFDFKRILHNEVIVAIAIVWGRRHNYGGKSEVNANKYKLLFHNDLIISVSNSEIVKIGNELAQSEFLQASDFFKDIVKHAPIVNRIWEGQHLDCNAFAIHCILRSVNSPVSANWNLLPIHVQFLIKQSCCQ